MKWNNVKNKLPSIEKDVHGFNVSKLVLAFWATKDPDYEPGGIETSFFDGRHWQGADGSMDYHGARNVTHWMDLPDEPTGYDQ